MKHTIMCSCGKLAINCKEASEGLQSIVLVGKKEVFDDIEKIDILLSGLPTRLGKLASIQLCKKKHLFSDNSNKEQKESGNVIK